jgi:hypothetical protein
LPSGKHGATTEQKDTLTLLLKMVLTGFGRRLECRLGRLVRKLEEVLISLLRILISILCYFGLRQIKKIK